MTRSSLDAGADRQADASRHDRQPTAALRPLLAVAVAVSTVHYADNAFNYGAYPQPTSDPAPSQTTLVVSWFGFTALAAAAWVLLRRGRITSQCPYPRHAAAAAIGVGSRTCGDLRADCPRLPSTKGRDARPR